MLALVGCTSTVATTPRLLADFPLFSNADGMATLTVTVLDARRNTQDFADVQDADRVRFTLTSARSLSASGKTATRSITLGASQTYDTIFTGLRPDSDYYLRADLYKQSDLTNESSFTQNLVRAAGVSNVLTLAAGTTSPATIKINSVGSVSFGGSVNSNKVDDFKVVEGDVLTIDTGMHTGNNPLVRRIDVAYLQGTSGAQRGSTLTTSTITSTSASFSWTVPTITTNQESGTLYVTGYDAASGGKQLTQKTAPVVIYKGSSLGAVTNQITLQ